LIFWVEQTAAGSQEVDADEVLEGFQFVALAFLWWLGVGCFLRRSASPLVPDIFQVRFLEGSSPSGGIDDIDEASREELLGAGRPAS